MRDLVFLVAMAWSLYGLYRWHLWYWPILVLAAVSLLERPEPAPEPAPRFVAAGLTQADVGWGRNTFPAVTHELVVVR